MSLKQVFDKFAHTYDSARMQLVPCFEDFYGTAVHLIPYGVYDHFHALDLGAGTGLLSLFVSEAYPKAKLTLMDISDDMLAKARERFSSLPERFDFITADYAADELTGKFDVVMSALSIHHLSDPGKALLFQNIYRVLSDDGIFINADQVRGETEVTDRIYREKWLLDVRKNGVSESDLVSAFERMKEDKMATLNDQLCWLKGAGFQQVNCWYKNFSFVVYGGRKKCE